MPQIGEIKKAIRFCKGKPKTDKWVWLACPDCNKERWVKFYYANLKHFICPCFPCGHKFLWDNPSLGSQTSNWKGGRITLPRGYIQIRLHPDDPFYPMLNCRGYVMEHRLIMARQLGRCLYGWEIVHHLNGIKTDNRPVNLVIVGKNSHQGNTYIKSLQKRIRDLEANLSQGIIGG